MPRKGRNKQFWETIDWAKQVADAAGVTYEDLDLEEEPDESEDEEIDTDEYVGEYDDYEPALRGRSGKGRNKGRAEPQGGGQGSSQGRNEDKSRDLRMQAARAEKGGEDVHADSEHRIGADLADEAALDEKRAALKGRIEALDDRVIEVRFMAPTLPKDLQFLVKAYTGLDRLAAKAVDTMDDRTLDGLSGKVDTLEERLGDLERMFAANPEADLLALWAANRKEERVVASREKLALAMKVLPPNAAEFKAACDELSELKTELGVVDDAKRAFEDARAKIKYSDAVGHATAKEKTDLEKLNTAVGKACEPGTQAAYEFATKKLSELANLVTKVEKAHVDRETAKVDLARELAAATKAFDDTYGGLTGVDKKQKDAWRKDKNDVVKAAEDELRKSADVLRADVVEKNIDRISEIVDSMNEEVARIETEKLEAQARKHAAADKASYANFNHKDNKTWVIQPLVYAKIPYAALVTSPADQVKWDQIENGTLGEGTCWTGKAYHCHMINGGSGGVSFAYNHLGGNRVQPVIYDYAVSRYDNKYNWQLGGGKKQKTSARLPGYIKERRPPPA